MQSYPEWVLSQDLANKFLGNFEMATYMYVLNREFQDLQLEHVHLYFHIHTMTRKQPNIVITGTPGVGKTSHCELLAQNTGLKHLAINQIVKERNCHDGWDEPLQSWIVDEDKVCLVEDDATLFPWTLNFSSSWTLSKGKYKRAGISSIGTPAIYFPGAGLTS